MKNSNMFNEMRKRNVKNACEPISGHTNIFDLLHISIGLIASDSKSDAETN